MFFALTEREEILAIYIYNVYINNFNTSMQGSNTI